jgi:DNA modification methylase
MELLQSLKENSIDACITDPPYGMGMDVWDHSVPPKETWEQVLRVLKPGAFCLSFCSPELYHRMAVNVEDGGFRILDQIMWMTTTKMVKHNRLKPAHEPIAVGQKPYEKSLKYNQEKWGVGFINIKGNKIPWDGEPPTGWIKGSHDRRAFGGEVKKAKDQKNEKVDADPEGRYPSNILGEVLPEHQKYFYAPRASRTERGKYNDHPTPKPIELMKYLVKVYSPKGGIVLDPYNGSGSTGIACMYEGREYIGMELDKRYCEITEKRIKEHSPLGI